MDNQPSEQESRFHGLHWSRREKSSDRRNQSERDREIFGLSLPRREKNNRNRSRDRGTTKSPIPPKQRKKSEKSGCKRTDLWSQAYSKVQQENPKLLVAFKKYLLAAKSMWNVLSDCVTATGLGVQHHCYQGVRFLLYYQTATWHMYKTKKNITLVSGTAMVNAFQIAECFCHDSTTIY